jgi:hypothetical protein
MTVDMLAVVLTTRLMFFDILHRQNWNNVKSEQNGKKFSWLSFQITVVIMCTTVVIMFTTSYNFKKLWILITNIDLCHAIL